jgi:hypothetical protein
MPWRGAATMDSLGAAAGGRAGRCGGARRQVRGARQLHAHGEGVAPLQQARAVAPGAEADVRGEAVLRVLVASPQLALGQRQRIAPLGRGGPRRGVGVALHEAAEEKRLQPGVQRVDRRRHPRRAAVVVGECVGIEAAADAHLHRQHLGVAVLDALCEGVRPLHQQQEEEDGQPEAVVLGRAVHRVEAGALELGRGELRLPHLGAVDGAGAQVAHLERVRVHQRDRRVVGGDQDVALVDVAHHVAGAVQRVEGRGQARPRPVHPPPVEERRHATARDRVVELEDARPLGTRHQEPGEAAVRRGKQVHRPGQRRAGERRGRLDHPRQLARALRRRRTVELGDQRVVAGNAEHARLAPRPDLQRGVEREPRAGRAAAQHQPCPGERALSHGRAWPGRG